MTEATDHHPAFGPLRQVDAGLLKVGDADIGPADGRVAVLLHGWPYDINSYGEVAPMPAAAGYRVVVPYLRGFGTTRFLSDTSLRNGEQAALALDVIALLDHVEIVIHNYRWRLGLADGEADYQELERRLADGPVIGVPTITLEGDANGAPHPDPAAYAEKFTGRYTHRLIGGGVGHNLPQDAPEAFATAVLEVDTS